LAASYSYKENTMKVILLGGFLGSGKTTFLLKLAPYLAARSKKDPAVVVLENEISNTDVDTKLLESLNLTVRNLAAGCICCTSAGALPDSVAKIKTDFDPDYLIIEATGMAFPDAIAQTIETENQLPVTVAILADASRWDRLNRAMSEFVHGQLKRADIVLLNKTDKVRVEKMEQIRDGLSRLVSAPVYPIQANTPIDPSAFSDLV